MTDGEIAVPIDVDTPADLTKWSRTFGVEESRLLVAIAAVGKMPAALAFYFRSNSAQPKTITDEIRAEFAAKHAARKRRSPKSV